MLSYIASFFYKNKNIQKEQENRELKQLREREGSSESKDLALQNTILLQILKTRDNMMDMKTDLFFEKLLTEIKE